MKSQVAWNWKAARTELVVTSQKREKLNIAEAEWLQNPPTERLIPVDFDYSQAMSKKVVLRYEIMGKTKLRKLLKARTMPTSVFVGLLEGLEEAVNACTASGHVIDRMLFDVSHVYLDEQKRPYFVFVPFTGMEYDSEVNTPLVMINAMCNPRRMHLQSAEGERLRDVLHRHVLQDKVFSSNALRKIIDREISSSRDVDGIYVSDPSTRSTSNTVSPPVFMDELFDGRIQPRSRRAAFVLRRVDTNEVVELPEGCELTVGRSPTCDIMFGGNPYMGRKHLTLMVMDGEAIITDCGSANGTYAYNKRLTPKLPVRITAGNCFLVGGEKFYFLSNQA